MQAGQQVSTDPYVDLLAARTELEEVREANRRMSRQLSTNSRNKADLINAVYQAAKDAAISQPPLPKPAKVSTKKGTSAHHALLHTTDWQGGKRTKDFDLDVLRDRLSTMMDVSAVLSERHGNPVTSATILLGGDMIEGVNIFPTQPFEIHAGLYDQVFAVVDNIRMVIDRALAIWPTVNVVSKWGNHGRIGRFGELPDADNLDRMAYRIAAERYASDARVTWDYASLDYVQQFQIGNYRGALLHGNEFHKSFSAQRIVQKLTAWQTMYDFGDAYLGHFHRRDTYGMANGTMVYMTGSPESSNAYAADQLAARSDPTQRLHFIDPERGRVNAEHILWL